MENILNTASGKLIKTNPWVKRTLNFTDSLFIEKTNPKLAEQLKAEAVRLDAEDYRRTHTRTLIEFNELDTAGKIQFIKNGGRVE